MGGCVSNNNSTQYNQQEPAPASGQHVTSHAREEAATNTAQDKGGHAIGEPTDGPQDETRSTRGGADFQPHVVPSPNGGNPPPPADDGVSSIATHRDRQVQTSYIDLISIRHVLKDYAPNHRTVVIEDVDGSVNCAKIYPRERFLQKVHNHVTLLHVAVHVSHSMKACTKRGIMFPIRLVEDPETNSFLVVTEYHAARNLRNALPSSHVQLRSMLKQLLNSINYLHFHRIIHGNLRPENVTSPRQGRYALHDFLISNAQFHFEQEPITTRCQNPYTCAPEVLRNGPGRFSEYEWAVDIWSVGALAAFVAFDVEPTVLGLRYDDVASLHPRIAIDNGILKLLRDFLKATLEPDPKRRPPAKDLLHHDLFTSDAILTPAVRELASPHSTCSRGGTFLLVPSEVDVQRTQSFSITSPQEISCDHCGKPLEEVLRCYTCSEKGERFQICTNCFDMGEYGHDATHHFLSFLVSDGTLLQQHNALEDGGEAAAMAAASPSEKMLVPASALTERERELYTSTGELPTRLTKPGAKQTAKATKAPKTLGGPVQEEEESLESILANSNTELLLYTLGLETIPAAIFALPQLESIVTLELTKNKLTELPQEISMLKSLKKLVVGENRLTSIPETIGDLEALEVLDVNHNKLTDLPPTLMFNEALHTLAMDYNDFDALPGVFADIPWVRNIYMAANTKVHAWPSVENLRRFERLKLSLDNQPDLYQEYEARIKDALPNVEMLWNKVYPDKVTPEGLYIGSLRSVQTPMVYEKLNIGSVLSVGRDLHPDILENMMHKAVNVDDIEGANMCKQFEETTQFIEESLAQNRGCIVHCFAGMSRSATSCIAYLMMRKGMRLDDAYMMVKGARPAIFPNKGFFAQLVQLDETLFPGQRPLNLDPLERHKPPI